MSDEKKELARVALKRVAVADLDPYQSTAEQLRELGDRLGARALDLSRLKLPLKLLDLIPRETAEAHCLLPVQLSNDRLRVVTADPSKKRVIEELEFVTGKEIDVYVAPAQDIYETIASAYLQFRRREEFFCGPNYKAGGSDPPSSRSAPAATELATTAPEAEPSKESTPLDAGGQLVIEVATDASLTLGPVSAAPELAPAADIPDLEVAVPSAKAPPAITQQSPEFDLERVGAQSMPVSFPNGNRTAAAPQKTALVVEDDQAIAELVKRLLQSRGLAVVNAIDGGEGLRAMKQANYDLVVLDAMLPKVHGFELVRRMRLTERLKAVPVIIVTAAHRGWEYAEDLRQAWGVRHYLEKPFSSERFLMAVDEAVGRETKEINRDAAVQLQAGIAAFKKGDLAGAKQHLELGVTKDPLAYELHFHLGLLHGKLGHPFEAINAIQQAVELNPDYFPAVKNLAILYLRTGFRHKSAEMWHRALGIAPDEATKTSIRHRLAGLQA